MAINLFVLGFLFGCYCFSQRAYYQAALVMLLSCGAGLFCKQKAVAFNITQCVAVAEEAILSFRPDIVVGYSWGGGIMYYLIERGIWTGPCLLLAPAAHLIAWHAGLPPPNLEKALVGGGGGGGGGGGSGLPGSPPALDVVAGGSLPLAGSSALKGLIVHGDLDPVVNVKDSHQLMATLPPSVQGRWAVVTNAHDDHFLFKTANAKAIGEWIAWLLNRKKTEDGESDFSTAELMNNKPD
jgi:hypothetical protein